MLMKQALLRVVVAGLAGVMLVPAAAAAWNDPSSGEGREGLGDVVPPKEPSWRVGQIFIIGNDVTPHDIILEAVGLCPGERITRAELRAAERRLAGLGLFRTERGREPRVRILTSPLLGKDQEFFDIRVDVEEKPGAIVARGLADGLAFIRAWNKEGFFVAVDEAGGVLGDLIKWLRGPKRARLALAAGRIEP